MLHSSDLNEWAATFGGWVCIIDDLLEPFSWRYV